MNPKILSVYRRLRADPVSMLVGYGAANALREARTITRFHELESAGVVRIYCEEESESYFDVYGDADNERERAATVALIERWGCVCVVTEWFDGNDWQHADSIGMCIYRRPDSPFENCYVVGLMAGAIEEYECHAEGLREDLALALGEAEPLASA